MELIICILPYFLMLFSYIILSLTSYVSKSRVLFYLAILVVMLFVGFKDIILPVVESFAVEFENIENIGEV